MTINRGSEAANTQEPGCHQKGPHSLEGWVNGSLMKYNQDKCQMPSLVPARQSPAAIRIRLGKQPSRIGPGHWRPGPPGCLGSNKGQQCLESHEQVTALRAGGGQGLYPLLGAY